MLRKLSVMLLSRHQNAGQNLDIEMANRSFENVSQLKYLGTSVTNPNVIRKIKSRRLRWAGHVARMGEKRNAYKLLVGKPEGRKLLRTPRRRW
jgi:hypothetical protein